MATNFTQKWLKLCNISHNDGFLKKIYQGKGIRNVEYISDPTRSYDKKNVVVSFWLFGKNLELKVIETCNI